VPITNTPLHTVPVYSTHVRLEDPNSPIKPNQKSKREISVHIMVLIAYYCLTDDMQSSTQSQMLASLLELMMMWQ